MKPCPGDILAVSPDVSILRPSTWLPWRIQCLTRSKYSHVGLVVRSAEGREPMVVEALWHGGVVCRSIRKAYGKGSGFRGALAIGRLEQATICTLDSACRWAICQVGKPYNRRKIVQIRVLQFLFGHRATRSILAPSLDRDSEFICSQLVLGALRQAGHPFRGCGDFAGAAAVMESPTVTVSVFRWR